LYHIIKRGKIVEANGIDLLKFTFTADCIVEIKQSQNEDNIIVELYKAIFQQKINQKNQLGWVVTQVDRFS